MSSSAIRRAAPAALLNAAVATAQVWPLASNNQLACTTYAPGKLALEGKSFKVRAEGILTTAAAATTALITLLAATVLPASPLVAANWTTLAAGAATAVTAVVGGSGNFLLESTLQFESASGSMQGLWYQLLNNVSAAAAPIAARLTGLNGTNSPASQLPGPTVVPPADPVIYFAAAVTFSAGAAGNVGNLVNFEVAF